MDTFLLTSFTSLGLFLLFILYMIGYDKIIKNRIQRLIVEFNNRSQTLEQEEALKEIQTDLATVRFDSMEKIRSSMEAKIARKVEERSIKLKAQLIDNKNEGERIEEGGKVYMSFAGEFKSAIPSTTAEKEKDMHDLMAAVKALEMLDRTNYRVTEETSVDMGKGMFYDSIARKLNKIIRKNNYKSHMFIQAEKLELEAFNAVKHMQHEDFQETLQIMKEVGTFKQIIEINSEISLIIFKKNFPKLSSAEQVVISLVAENFEIDKATLQALTSWKTIYQNKILREMEEKHLIKMKDNSILIDGLITRDERESLNNVLADLNKEKISKLKAEQRSLEKFEAKREGWLEDAAEEKVENRTEKSIKVAKKLAQKQAEQMVINAEKLAEIEEKERLEKMRAMPMPKIKKVPEFEIPGEEGFTEEIDEEGWKNMIPTSDEELKDDESADVTEDILLKTYISTIFIDTIEDTGGLITDDEIISRLTLQLNRKIKKIEIMEILEELKS